MKDLFKYSDLPLVEFLSEAANIKDRLVKCIILPASDRLVGLLADSDSPIDGEYLHVIDNFSCRHIRARHSGMREILRGQIPISPDDLKRIPEILSNFKSMEIRINKIGNAVLVYSHTVDDGTFFLIEEIRRRRKELAVCTLYKRKRKLTDANRPEDDADSGFVSFPDHKSNH